MVGRDIRDLRADVHRQAPQHESRLGRDPPCHIHDFVERHSELCGLLACLRIGMRRFRRHIGIRANANSRRHLHLVRDRDDRVELACGFDIDESHAGTDCFLDFRVRLADAREHDAVRVEARGQSPDQRTAQQTCSERESSGECDGRARHGTPPSCAGPLGAREKCAPSGQPMRGD